MQGSSRSMSSLGKGGIDGPMGGSAKLEESDGSGHPSVQLLPHADTTQHQPGLSSSQQCPGQPLAKAFISHCRCSGHSCCPCRPLAPGVLRRPWVALKSVHSAPSARFQPPAFLTLAFALCFFSGLPGQVNSLRSLLHRPSFQVAAACCHVRSHSTASCVPCLCFYAPAPR